MANPQIEDGQLNRKREDKQSPENLGDVLKTEGIPQIEETSTTGRLTPMAETSAVEQQPPFSLLIIGKKGDKQAGDSLVDSEMTVTKI